MNIMFRVDSTKIVEIYDLRFINIFSPYKTFFGSTMVYEGLGMALRMSLYNGLQEHSPIKNSVVNGATAGMATQVMM